MNKRHVFGAVAALILINGCSAEEPKKQTAPVLNTDDQKFSYFVGLQVGQNLNQNGLDKLDMKSFNMAIEDVMAGRQPRLTEEQLRASVEAYQKKRQDEMVAAADKNMKAGQEFLSKNKAAAGVVTTASGLQYKVLKEGTGKKPGPQDTVVVHYRGTLLDGTEFDSSHKRGEPATFQVGQVVPGWQEALQLMPAGSKWQVWVPSDLAYGPQGAGGTIGPNQTLVFEIELQEVK